MTTAAETTTELTFRRRALHLWRCGPRAVAELLAEIGAERSLGTIIDEKLLRYAALDPATLRALGADRLPPVPVHLVSGRDR